VEHGHPRGRPRARDDRQWAPRPRPQGHDHPARPAPSASPCRSPKQDVLGRSREQFEAQIQSALGGRIAEELFFGKLTTGASNDIKHVTQHRARHGVRVRHEREARPARLRQRRELHLPRPRLRPNAAGLLRADRPRDRPARSARSSRPVRPSRTPARREEGHSSRRSRRLLMDRETLDADELVASSRAASSPRARRSSSPRTPRRTRREKEKRKAASIFGGPPKPATST
jgi:cell division protease FtsH